MAEEGWGNYSRVCDFYCWQYEKKSVSLRRVTDNRKETVMQTTRQQKIERLIQKDLSDIFLRYAHQFSGVLISVSEVRISPDLSIAHAYVSIFPSAKAEETMQRIEDDTHKLRGELGNIERHQLRIIPELHFHLDDTLDRMEHIDELLRQ